MWDSPERVFPNAISYSFPHLVAILSFSLSLLFYVISYQYFNPLGIPINPDGQFRAL